MYDHAAEFEKAMSEGLHAYEVDLKGKPSSVDDRATAHLYAQATAYVYAHNEEQAKVEAMKDSDPSEEEPGDVRLQTWKMYVAPKGMCPCIVCATRRGESPEVISIP